MWANCGLHGADVHNVRVHFPHSTCIIIQRVEVPQLSRHMLALAGGRTTPQAGRGRGQGRGAPTPGRGAIGKGRGALTPGRGAITAYFSVQNRGPPKQGGGALEVAPSGGGGRGRGGSGGRGGGSNCFKCGQEGHWARDCPG